MAAADSEEKTSPSADVRGMEDNDRSFKVGERVMRRDTGEEWKPGYVTEVDPLKVTVSPDDPQATGYEWDEVKAWPAQQAGW